MPSCERGDASRSVGERGAGYAEYGLLVGLIAIVAAVGVGAFGTFLNGFFGGLSGALPL